MFMFFISSCSSSLVLDQLKCYCSSSLVLCGINSNWIGFWFVIVMNICFVFFLLICSLRLTVLNYLFKLIDSTSSCCFLLVLIAFFVFFISSYCFFCLQMDSTSFFIDNPKTNTMLETLKHLILLAPVERQAK